ncbi:MAG: hypothetical protein LUD29_04540 [Clostridia bacterium]|nr:hypothetical protein [Clostridia bacterium]
MSEREFDIINREVKESGMGRREFFTGALKKQMQTGEDKLRGDMACLDECVTRGLAEMAEINKSEERETYFQRMFEISDAVLDNLSKVLLGGADADGDSSF